ncbi:MAG TPA: prepilin-type N-terminal cleavage/methylation domain-containing protein [Planctomycetota bacterium]|nr:prepilin-type N-terminal cleavage/methylation domain-containing protein [Planctomycetota bacterium]
MNTHHCDRTLHLCTRGRRRQGFTLLEMIVVLSIFALLTGIAIPVAGVALRIEETNSTRDRMADLSEGIRNFYHDTARFPITLDELITAPKKVVGWAGRYVNQGFTDPKGSIFYDGWQNAFQYLNVDAYTKRLRSLGLNGSNDGGTGDDIDLDVNVADLLRDVNNDILSEINTAISLYNRFYRLSSDTTSGDQADSGDDVIDVPLAGPWSNVLAMLAGAGLLSNSNGRYTADVWGNAFITGPDPVQYVTSQGSN